MSRALRHINPNESVRHLFAWTLRETRCQAGFSLQGFAKRLGKSDSYLSAVELAEVRCTREFAEMCDRLLGTGGRLVGLWVHADAEWSQLTGKRPVGSRSGPHLQSEQPNQEVRIVPVAAGEDMGADAMVMWCVDGKVYAMPTRRELLKLLGAGAVVGTVGSTVDRGDWSNGNGALTHIDPSTRLAEGTEHQVVLGAAHESSEHAGAAESARIGPTTVEQLHEDVVRLARSFVYSPPLPLFSDMVRVRNRVYRSLNLTRQPEQERDLHLFAGVLCGLLSSASFDLGYPNAATEQARAAWAYGEIVGHNELRAWVCGTQALIAFWSDRSLEATTLVDKGLRYAPSGSAQVRLRCIAARAWALLGDRANTRQAIDAAKDARELSQDTNELHDRIGGEFGWGEARQAFCSGSAFLQVGDLDRALNEDQRAVALYQASPIEQRWYAAETSARVDLAAVHLMLGELDGAQQTLSHVFALPSEKRVEGVVKRLGQVRNLLTQPAYLGSRPAADLGEQIEEFAANTVAHGVPGIPTSR